MKRHILLMTLILLTSILCTYGQDALKGTENRQFKNLVDEIAEWKRILRSANNDESRTAVDELIRRGVEFQRKHEGEANDAVKQRMIDEYIQGRDRWLEHLSIILTQTRYYSDGTSESPTFFSFAKDDLEMEPKRPFAFQSCAYENDPRRSGYYSSGIKRTPEYRILFSYRESREFAAILSAMVEKMKTTGTMKVPARDFTASVQIVSNAPAIFIEFNKSSSRSRQEAYKISEFDAKLLINQIHRNMALMPPPSNYAEPGDIDPVLVNFNTGLTKEEPSAVLAGTLVLDVQRKSVSSGRPIYSGWSSSPMVGQQFNYSCTLRWTGTQTIEVNVVMYLFAPMKDMQTSSVIIERGMDEKWGIVGKESINVTVELGRTSKMDISTVQKIAGKTASGIIIQCFSGGQLLKQWGVDSYWTEQAKKSDIESRFYPLYRNSYYY